MKAHHRVLWILATVGGLIILWLLLNRNKNTNIVNPAAQSSNVYNIASPGGRTWTGGASGLPWIPPSDPNDCGCTSSNGGNFYTSVQDMINQFVKGSAQAFAQYESNVYNGYPSSLTQYFNNPVGAGQSQDARNAFGTSATGNLMGVDSGSIGTAYAT